MKRNYKMTVSYDGTRYFGWERQPGKELTIQGKLESVLNLMTDASPDSPVTVIGAGRTDAGVHARAMTANVLLDTDMSEEEIRSYMNRYLPDSISVDELKICADRFHSRFKAKGKTYCYTCWCDVKKPVFDRRYVTVLEARPDAAAMRAAAAFLTGTHDYKSFCGNSHMKKSTVRCVDSIEIKERGSYIRFYFHGNGFLQHMVRILTGTLLEVGYGRLKASDMPAILEACDRTAAGPTAPAKGLMLMSVDY
ncbi:MAG: tRNA pseudouridine(38-40) synthase TruA [Eubacterium sp.]|nr:tRNA pseudouridine(38-40) synthase TruA [Eubacterium sp.]